jgi:hypothetical protein
MKLRSTPMTSKFLHMQSLYAAIGTTIAVVENMVKNSRAMMGLSMMATLKLDMASNIRK